MNLFKLINSSFRFYWKRNLYVSLAVAICTAVITGALIVGDSVRHSLEQSAQYRLGASSHTITAGDSYFTQQLASRLGENEDIATSPVLKLEGSVASSGGDLRLNKVLFWGVDQNFKRTTGSDYYDSIPEGEAIVSRNLALRLNLEVGNSILIKIEKAGLMPKNTPFVTDEEQFVSRRVKISKIADKEHLGRFGLQNSQTAPFNVFVSIDWLNDLMELDGRANIILINSEKSKTEIDSALKKAMSLKDIGLSLKLHPNKENWLLGSEKVFLKDQLTSTIERAIPKSQAVLTYFANSIEHHGNISPYSFVSTFDGNHLAENEIVINSWLAEDIKAKVGDTLSLKYFTIGLLRKLEEHARSFVVKEIIPIENQKGDEVLMPDIPGLSDTEKCSEWETGIPIDLKAIREIDEKYWYDYGGTPKAFVNVDMATGLWKNRFGTYTSILIPAQGESAQSIGSQITNSIHPEMAGFKITAVKLEALSAAQNGTDFSQLFIGLSFFIIVSALLLVSILFLFNLEHRSIQIGHFSALGFSSGMIRKIILAEGFLVALLGTLVGLLLAIVYNNLVFMALSRVWQDIVRTDVLETSIQFNTLAIGFLASLLISLLTLLISVTRLLKRNITQLQKKQAKVAIQKRKRMKWIGFSVMILGLAVLLFLQITNESGLNPVMFFAAGGILLVAALLLTDIIFWGIAQKHNPRLNTNKLAWRNLVRNRRRSLMVIILLSIGSFLVITTGANRQDLYSGANEKSSGTGGFLLMAESTLPVLKNLNDASVRKEFGFETEFQVCQFRKHAGDDASCLNLNRISNPQILGFDPQKLDGRFSFVAKTDDLDVEHPWLSLDKNLEELIPAIADQTVIQWGLGKKVGDTLIYQNEAGENLYLKLIGGLAGSIFQGNVLISENHFLENFPSSSGSNFFLIEGKPEHQQQIEEEFQLAFRDLGWEMVPAVEKLAEFKSVENTYLSIFLILGALGLLLGTVGLSIVLARSIYERRQEIAVYVVSGFNKIQILNILVLEYFYLLLIGSLSGLISALLAVLPGLLNRNLGISTWFLIVVIATIIVHGTIWIVGISIFQIKKMKITEALRNE
ncbi:MAG: FtsX-like permease family protein [Bacteroidales bacterium]|nr:FtsX-like permease family protein [Bacteroidales bacterium]MCF8456088.1 FtsX-like permease family protein [Bacteroidales bacterium]